MSSLNEPTPWRWVLFQNPKSRSTIQEFLDVLWSPQVHYCVHKSPPLVPILSQMNPMQNTSSYFSEIHLHIILPSMSRSSQLSRSLCFPTKTLYALLQYFCYIPCPSNPPCLRDFFYTWWRMQVTKLLSIQLTPALHYFIPLPSKYYPRHPVRKYLQFMFFP
jgi:hypothetical protein